MNETMEKAPLRSIFMEPIVLDDDYHGYSDSPFVYTQADLMADKAREIARREAARRETGRVPIFDQGLGNTLQQQKTLRKCSVCLGFSVKDAAVCVVCNTQFD